MRSTESQNAVRPRSTVEASEGVRRPRATSVTKLTAAGTRPPPHAMASIERPFDVTMLVTIAMLMGFGVVMVYSASVGVADMTYGDPLRFLKSHLLHLMVGVVAFAVGMGLNYQFYRRLVYPLLMAFFAVVFARSAWRTYVRRSVTWRGRAVPVRAARP